MRRQLLPRPPETQCVATSWHTARELAGLPGMPPTPAGVLTLIGRPNFLTYRKRRGEKTFEFPFAELPPETQAALLAGVKAVTGPTEIARLKRLFAATGKRLRELKRLSTTEASA